MDRRQLALAALVFGAILFSYQRATATALSVTGNQLYNNYVANTAGATTEWLMAGMCMGYVTAVTDALAGGGAVNGYRACISPDSRHEPNY